MKKAVLQYCGMAFFSNNNSLKPAYHFFSGNSYSNEVRLGIDFSVFNALWMTLSS